jgi:hypothetical protein
MTQIPAYLRLLLLLMAFVGQTTLARGDRVPCLPSAGVAYAPPSECTIQLRGSPTVRVRSDSCLAGAIAGTLGNSLRPDLVPLYLKAALHPASSRSLPFLIIDNDEAPLRVRGRPKRDWITILLRIFILPRGKHQ